nr:MAG TPA: hypothetical protein [Caudoviricetes sp.]
MNLKSRNHRVVLLTIGYPVPYTVFWTDLSLRQRSSYAS